MRGLNSMVVINAARNAGNIKDEFDVALEGTPFAAAVKAAREKKLAADTEALTDQVLAVMEHSTRHTDRQVQVIRNARRQEKEAKDSLAKRDRCLAYGLETGNLLPISLHLGLIGDWEAQRALGEDFKKLSEVPGDWSPKAPASE